jgi:hypothetical protein
LARDLAQTYLYHITDVANLPSILASGGLVSDCALAGVDHQVIGYAHVKHRRMTQYRVTCCDNRFVGEFVPFYFCARSPMLYTVNKGNSGRPPGCQTSIVHLVTTVATALSLGRRFAISDGNAGAECTTFRSDLAALDDPNHLRWADIETNNWQGKMHFKMAEFLIADRFDWAGVMHIGCHNRDTADQVRGMLPANRQAPRVDVQRSWYY